MATRTPRKPTHNLCVKDRETGGHGRIGVGWYNRDGSMQIQLNPCVSLTSRDNVIISLFPRDEQDKGQDSGDDSIQTHDPDHPPFG